MKPAVYDSSFFWSSLTQTQSNLLLALLLLPVLHVLPLLPTLSLVENVPEQLLSRERTGVLIFVAFCVDSRKKHHESLT